MEFKGLKQQYNFLKKEVDTAISSVIEETNFISGHQIKELETQLAQYVGVKHCLSCANGTDALSLVLMAWNIGPKDAVFVPDFTFFASAEVVSFSGATPVFVDVDADTYNIDCVKLEDAIKGVIAEGNLLPKVIIAVDLFGQPAEYDKIKVIADKYSLLILEDSAQGFGGKIGGKHAGSFGDAATTSFFPVKPLGCYGDGGAIFTNDSDIAKLIDSYRNHGKGSYKYDNVRVGLNSRLDTLQAALLLPKFKAFVEFELNDINNAADYYKTMLASFVKVPYVKPLYYSSWAQYTIQLKDEKERDALKAALKEKEIPTMIYYPTPMHAQTAFSNLPDRSPELPVSSELCKRVLVLPLHPYITKTEQDIVIDAILEFMKGVCP